MKINLSVRPIMLNDDYEIISVEASSPLANLMKELIAQLSDHPEIRNLKTIINANDYPDVDFPDCDAVNIGVFLCEDHEDLDFLCHAKSDEVPLGVFCVQAGAFDPDAQFSNEFRVVVSCDEERYKSFVREERTLESDPLSDRHDSSYLSAYLATLTHEIKHALEFVQHGGGLTPAEVDVLHDDGAVEFDVTDTCTGVRVRPEMEPLIMGTAEEREREMEGRVEEEGIELLHWAMDRVPKHFIEDCLKLTSGNDAGRYLDAALESLGDKKGSRLSI